MGTPIMGDEDEDVGAVTPTGRVPYHEQSTSQKWEQLKAHTFIVFNDPDDGADYLSVGEVLEVEHRGSDKETFIVLCLVHRHSLSNSYKHNMPLVQQRLSPEYVDGRVRISTQKTSSRVYLPPLGPEGSQRGAPSVVYGRGKGLGEPNVAMTTWGYSCPCIRFWVRVH